ncbi:hypothetical protein AXX17_ATUG04690 [Arabidopsis thaliana]|uniref:Protein DETOXIFICATION n=1 Tax=Arabidopsis thaliana TaxID=3702 RepID=A0A178U5F2_ARATH|nr:hypothetical protein AXX17_ATUG04690 [Arabidopsis thaliana]
MEAENLHYFEKAPIAKAVAHFAVPMMLGTSMSVIYSILNAYFLGTLNNTAILTALALTLPLFAIIMALGNLIGVGSGTFISRLLGEKRYEDVKNVSSFAFYSSIVLGLIVIAVGLPLIDSIVHGLGATTEAFGFTKDYVTVMLIGSPIVVLFFTLENIVRSEGAAITSMTGMILSVIVNIILDALVIFVFHGGIVGVASATVISNLAASVYFIFYMNKKSQFLTVSPKWFKATKEIMSNVFKIGVPVFIMSIFLGAMSLIFNRFLVEYGDQAVAAYGISSRLLQFPEFILMGLCEGVVPLIAFTFTANKLRMKETIGFTLKTIVALAVVFGILVYLISDNLIGLFTNDPQLIQMGSYILHVIFLSLFITGMTTLFTGIFQATGQGTAAFVMAIIQGVTLIPVLFIANHLNGFHGVVWSIVIADAVSFLVGGIMLGGKVDDSMEKDNQVNSPAATSTELKTPAATPTAAPTETPASKATGNKPDSEGSKEGTTTHKDGDAVLKEYSIVYKDHNVALSDVVDDAKLESMLGTAAEKKSHTYSKDDGLNMDTLLGLTEKQYKFPGIVIKTIDTAEDKKFHIFHIKITDPKFTTDRNIKVGDSVTELKKAYPEGNLIGNGASNEEDDYRYAPANGVNVMTFHIKDSKIASILMYTLLD